VIAEFHVGGDAKLNWYGVRHSITQQKLLHLYGLVAAELPEWSIGRFSGGEYHRKKGRTMTSSEASHLKPVGWAKPSLARSDSASEGGKTGEKGRGLRRQTPFERLGS